MIELFTLLSNIQDKQPQSHEFFQNYQRYPWNWVLMILIISFGTAYLAYSCNEKETPSTRFLITLFSFFFSGIYLIYYFILYIVFDKKCNGKDVSELIKKCKF